MRVTEADLAPFRDKSGRLALRECNTRWPAQFFEATHKVFASSWPNLSGAFSEGRNAQDVLEITILLAFTNHVPVLALGRDWLALEHFCGGPEFDLYRLIALQLNPHPGVYPHLRQIARDRWRQPLRPHELLCSQICHYRQELLPLGVECEYTWPLLSESMYPIDATQRNIDKIALDAPHLTDLVDGDWRLQYGEGPAILFLTQNSD